VAAAEELAVARPAVDVRRSVYAGTSNSTCSSGAFAGMPL